MSSTDLVQLGGGEEAAYPGPALEVAAEEDDQHHPHQGLTAAQHPYTWMRFLVFTITAETGLDVNILCVQYISFKPQSNNAG